MKTGYLVYTDTDSISRIHYILELVYSITGARTSEYLPNLTPLSPLKIYYIKAGISLNKEVFNYTQNITTKEA